jgi:hypothetical protein
MRLPRDLLLQLRDLDLASLKVKHLADTHHLVELLHNMGNSNLPLNTVANSRASFNKASMARKVNILSNKDNTDSSLSRASMASQVKPGSLVNSNPTDSLLQTSMAGNSPTGHLLEDLPNLVSTDSRRQHHPLAVLPPTAILAT